MNDIDQCIIVQCFLSSTQTITRSGVEENKLVFVRMTTTMTKIRRRNENYDEHCQFRLN